MNVFRKVLDALGIPQAEIVVSGDEYLVAVGEFHEPVQEIQHFILRSVFREVSAVHNHISVRKVFQKMVFAVSVGDLDNSHC